MADIKAVHRFARISATKVRPFTKIITGMTVQEGLNQLRFTPNRGAKLLEKVLKSAVANAEDRGARNVNQLTIKEAKADGGPMFKRMRPGYRGMGYLIKKRFAHISVIVDAPDAQ